MDAEADEMRGRVCLITGGSSGVGKAVARGLARRGAQLVLLARGEPRLELARGEIFGIVPEAQVETVSVDLGDFDAVRRFAAAFAGRQRALHVLLNAAGAAETERKVSPQGYELTLSTEFLGHFLLTALLLPLLKKGAPARVLTPVGNVTPLYLAQIELEDLQLERRYSWVRAKLQAALAKTLFTFELARRLAGSGVTANAFHPGLVCSSLTEHLPWFLRLPARAGNFLLSTESPTGVYLASSPEVAERSGRYFEGYREVAFTPGRYRPSALAARLWEVAEELTGLKVEASKTA
jgi:NAD(P)-dependent dehydrogenase (short-subunit alcohol dehydrogenase family)